MPHIEQLKLKLNLRGIFGGIILPLLSIYSVHHEILDSTKTF